MIDVGASVAVDGWARPLRVERLLGEGSQGSVYAAQPDDGSAAVALKWYFPHTATEQQWATIDALVDRGAPSQRFLWPMALASVAGSSEFGYVMPLRPLHYAGLSELLIGKVDLSFASICRLCIGLSDAFLQLHSQGLCYRDISFANVFFDPSDGSPLICDNDNVGVDGRAPISVLGTRRFMAPEIVRREAYPSSSTDLYSLAVLLFYVLMAGHPLVGRREREYACWDEVAEKDLFGVNPRFVFDPEDRTNAPDPTTQEPLVRYWTLYPGRIRQLFTQAFTVGLHDVHARVRESVWRSAAMRLLDEVQRCPACGKECFFDGDDPTIRRECWSCDSALPIPDVLRVGPYRIVVSDGARILGHHLRHDYDLGQVIGTVARHPTRPDLLGLRNDTHATWSAWLPSGTSQSVEPGRSIRVVPGTHIDLGAGASVVVEEPVS